MKKRRKDFLGLVNGKINIGKYILCDTILSKARGLMFRNKNFNTPLIFTFNRPGRYAIHSFFCRKFRAIWILKNKGHIKIIDDKMVSPWRLSVLPQEKFNLLIEIPL